jgi:glycosyltransferase involved in cell wall biosynthesis
MIMNILFLHRNFPAQFRHIATVLARDPNNKVVFITNREDLNIQGIQKIVYKLKREVPKNCHNYLKFYEESIIHGQAVAEVAIRLKKQGFTPDIIYGHTWGSTMFMKDIFPNVPLLCYFEWFYNVEGADIGFDGNLPNEDIKARTRCKNSHLLVDLYSCDAGISPTQWQKNQFPKEFHHKIHVLHDGVDTDFCKPDNDAKLLIKDKNIELTAKDEVITYATRGMEPYRGFPQFMEAVEKLLKKRPNAHIVIGGEDRICYGPQLSKGTFKEIMLNKLDLDMSRVHFTGGLPYNEYVKLLQISSAHVYLTYPFVLSWSLLDAMAAGCPIIASNTKPVLEVMQDNYNGLLVDFYDVNQIVEKVEYSLDNKDKIQQIRHNTRKTIIENYALKDLLPKHIKFLENLAFNKPRIEV